MQENHMEELYADEIQFIKGLGKGVWSVQVKTPRKELLRRYIETLKLTSDFSEEGKQFLRQVAMQEFNAEKEQEENEWVEETKSAEGTA